MARFVNRKLFLNFRDDSELFVFEEEKQPAAICPHKQNNVGEGSGNKPQEDNKEYNNEIIVNYALHNVESQRSSNPSVNGCSRCGITLLDLSFNSVTLL